MYFASFGHSLRYARRTDRGGARCNVLMVKVRRRIYSLWDEVDRVATALDRDGELVGVGYSACCEDAFAALRKSASSPTSIFEVEG
jgi:hypothetical protein